MADVRFGIVGTGFIAHAMAQALQQARNATLTAVSSRSRPRAEAFAAEHPGVQGVQGIEELVARPDVDVVYVATPTGARDGAVRAALQADKHVLADKPMPNAEAFQAWQTLADARRRLLLDATHFVHHPRTAAIQAQGAEQIGTPKSLYSSFYFPFSDLDNIRLRPADEPYGALGDMAWYTLRAAVEYLGETGPVRKLCAHAQRHPDTGAVIQADGMVIFQEGVSTSFSIGYTADTILMSLELIGTSGVLQMDDFVLDFTNSLAFDHSKTETGYRVRTGMAAREDVRWVATPSERPAQVRMLERFAEWAIAKDLEPARLLTRQAIKTQSLLDAVWSALD